MKRILQDDLVYEILSVVEEIPVGTVATYGQIARLIGRDRNARLEKSSVWHSITGITLVIESLITQADLYPVGWNKVICCAMRVFL